MRCAFCLWKKIEKGCKARKGNVMGLSCRTCAALNPFERPEGLLRTNKRRMPDRLLRHDGKEWFTKVERKEPKTLIVLITIDKFTKI